MGYQDDLTSGVSHSPPCRASDGPRVPWAAVEPLGPPPGPRRTYATATARRAPSIGPATYIQRSWKSPRAKSGPSERAGCIDAPLTGLAHRPARAMYAPTPTADSGPMVGALDAVPKIVLTNPSVRRVSTTKAWVLVKPAPAVWHQGLQRFRIVREAEDRPPPRRRSGPECSRAHVATGSHCAAQTRC